MKGFRDLLDFVKSGWSQGNKTLRGAIAGGGGEAPEGGIDSLKGGGKKDKGG